MGIFAWLFGKTTQRERRQPPGQPNVDDVKFRLNDIIRFLNQEETRATYRQCNNPQ